MAISVLLGTQSVSTAEPPSAVGVDDGDLGAELGGDQRGLVAARAAADDDDAGRRAVHQRLIMWPAMPWTASLTASDRRRVGEDVAGHLVGGQVPLLGQRQHRQQLGDVGADHVGAEDLVVLGVGDDLDEADRLAEALRLAVGARTGTSPS